MTVFLKRYGAILICAVIAIAASAQVLRNDLIWDDEYLISTAEKGALGGSFGAAISAPFWKDSGYVVSDLTDYWRPLTKTVLWIGRKAFDKAPWGMHLISLFVAAGAALALAALIRRALGARHPEAWRVGLWLGLAFLAHPVNAEVLCLAANVSDHLVLIFLVIEMIVLDEYMAGKGGVAGLIVTALAAFFACAAKETGVVAVLAPIAVLMIRASSGGTTSVPTSRRVWPWIAAVAPVLIYLALRTFVMSRHGNPTSPLSEGFSLEIMVLGFGQALLRTVYPVPRGSMIILGPGDVIVFVTAAAAWVLFAVKICIDVVRRRRLSLISVGGLFALALLAPSAAAPTPLQEANALATRYLALPLAGLLLGAAAVIHKRWGRVVEIGLVATVVLLSILSWVRITEWRNQLSFFVAELGYRPESEFARLNVAQTLCQLRAFNEAEEVLQPFLGREGRFESQLAEGAYQNTRAKIAAFRDGDIEGASHILEMALRKTPNDLVNVLTLADARDRAGRPDQAVIIVQKALSAPWFQDSRRVVIARYLERFKRRAAEAAAAAKP